MDGKRPTGKKALNKIAQGERREAEFAERVIDLVQHNAWLGTSVHRGCSTSTFTTGRSSRLPWFGPGERNLAKGGNWRIYCRRVATARNTMKSPHARAHFLTSV